MKQPEKSAKKRGQTCKDQADPKAKKKSIRKKAATKRVSLKPAAMETPPNLPKKKRSAWDRLTLKQKRFVKAYFETEGNAAEAARRAGYSPERARVEGSEQVSSGNIQAVFSACLDKAGLTDDFIAARLREGAEAKEIKFFAHEGVVTDERETTDYPTRHTYLATALKAKGLLRNKVDFTVVDPGSALPDSVLQDFRAIEHEEEDP